MKHYYIKYPRNFGNEYELYSVNAGTPAEAYLVGRGFERITRKNAEEKCAVERWARKTDPAFSGYAPAHVIPFDEIDPEDWYGSKTTVYEDCLKEEAEREAEEIAAREWYATYC